MRRLTFLFAAILVLSLATTIQAKPGGAVHASADLVDASGSLVGQAGLVEDAMGAVHVQVHVHGLAPGKHGIHIHTVGDCTLGTMPAFATAKGHFNPSGGLHGTHAGDLPNLTVNEAGIGRLNAHLEHLTLSPGALSVVDLDGSAVIIHQNEDDGVTDAGPLGPGNSGPRIACGVIHANE